MRLVIARCSVDYAGRLTAHLPEALRLIMVKADGCVAIHADGGAYKPLNWMNAPNRLVEHEDHWTITNPKGETLTIHLHEVLDDTAHELGQDPGLSKDGVEAHLQELLAADPTAIAAGLTLVRREYPTDIGPVDLLCRDEHGTAVAVEVKRRQVPRAHGARPDAAGHPWGVRRPGDQATGEGPRRVTRHRLRRGRLRRAARRA
jgi:RecB family endonuclease NucS